MFHGSWTASLCDRLYLVMPILATLGLLCAEGVCCIRIWTIHKRSRFIFSFLATLFTTMAGIQFYAISKYVAFRDETGSCIAAGQGVWLALYWLAPATLDVSMIRFGMLACTFTHSILSSLAPPFAADPPLPRHLCRRSRDPPIRRQSSPRRDPTRPSLLLPLCLLRLHHLRRPHDGQFCLPSVPQQPTRHRRTRHRSHALGA